MVQVTEDAKTELKRIHDARNLGPGQCLRLVTPPMWTGEGDFGIVVSVEGAMDHLVTHEGASVLYLDQGLMDQLPKAVLDYKETPHGVAFTLDVY